MNEAADHVNPTHLSNCRAELGLDRSMGVGASLCTPDLILFDTKLYVILCPTRAMGYCSVRPGQVFDYLTAASQTVRSYYIELHRAKFVTNLDFEKMVRPEKIVYRWSHVNVINSYIGLASRFYFHEGKHVFCLGGY